MVYLKNQKLSDVITPISLAVVSSAYIAYYSFRIAHKPRIFCNQRFRDFLRSEVPVLGEKYKPTFWSFGAVSQTLVRTAIKSQPVIHYKKQFLSLRDGGHVALDWVHNDESTQYPDPDTRPTVLLLPGFSGNCSESYILHFVQQAQQLGYRSVVFNNRGNGGAELKNPKIFCPANTEDLREVIEHLNTTLPRSPVVGAGVSIGALILSNYLSRVGPNSGLCGGFIVSILWDYHEAAKSLEQPLNRIVFNSFFCNGLKSYIEKYRHFFEEYDVDSLLKSSNVRDIDARFVARHVGYSSQEEYYADIAMHMRVSDVKTPLLALSAGDDPFAPEYTLPCDASEQSSHVALVVTKYGGHIGFIEGAFPTSTGYVDRVFAQFISAAIKNRYSLRAVLETPETFNTISPPKSSSAEPLVQNKRRIEFF